MMIYKCDMCGALMNDKDIIHFIMNKKSIQKLLDAGYILLRATNDGGSTGYEPKIKMSDTFGVWITLEIFDTKAARDRKVSELLEQEKYLFDQ